ncbi:hypothetical protein AB0B30_26740 [Streptomyces narbonensis]|uniref:Uncharacterized protein n=1 Tax=Streptomyces narbonensis TaxID=67333 RepID=A0ABV3CI92_9ACTN
MPKSRGTEDGFCLLAACPPGLGTPSARASTHRLAHAVPCFAVGRYEEGAVAARWPRGKWWTRRRR